MSYGQGISCSGSDPGYHMKENCFMFGPLAQLVEQGTLNPKVRGSSPRRPTRYTHNPLTIFSGSMFFCLLLLLQGYNVIDLKVNG